MKYALALLLTLSFPTAGQACSLLSAGQLTAVFEKTPALQQRSQLPGRCDYSWARADQQEIRQENRQELKAGANYPYTPAPLWNQVVLERYQVAENAEAAKSALRNLVQAGPPRRFGSPDPLKGHQFEVLSPTQAWDHKRRTLIFVLNTAIYRLHLKVYDLKPAGQKAAAQTLVSSLTTP